MTEKVYENTDYTTINQYLEVTIGTICDKLEDTIMQMTCTDHKRQREKLKDICQDYIDDIYTIIGMKEQ